MTFQNYETKNLARGTLQAGISAGDVTLILDGQGSLFPASNFLMKIEQYDITSTLENKPVLKREIAKCTTRVGDIFTIVRGSGYCPTSDTATTQTNTALSFNTGDTVTLIMTSEQIKDIQDEILLKADDTAVVHNTGDEVVAGVKIFSTNPKTILPTDDDDVATKQYVDDEIELSGNVPTLSETDIVMGQNGFEGQSIFLENQNRFALAVNSELVGNTSANTRRSIRQFGTGIAGNTFKLALKKTGTPTTFGFRIHSDLNGQDSGTLVDPNAYGTVTGASLTTSFVDTTCTLAGSITIPDFQAVHIVAFSGTYGAETVDAGNNFSIGYVNTTTTRILGSYNGTIWSGTIAKIDNFNGSVLDTNYWNNTNIGSIAINNKLYVQGAGGTATGYLVSNNTVNYTDCSIGATLGGTPLDNFNYTDANSVIRLYQDANNYAELRLAFPDSSINANVNINVVSAGISVYSYSAVAFSGYSYNSLDFKIKKVGTTFTFWKWTGSRVQIGASGTLSISNYKPYVGLNYDHGSTETPISVVDIDAFRISNTDFATQYPTEGGTNFAYVFSGLFADNVVSLTNSTNVWTSAFDGFLKTDCNVGSRAYYDFEGITTVLSGLTPNAGYYLANTAGLISTTAGTNLVLCGKANKDGLLEILYGKYPSVTSHPLNSTTTSVGQNISSSTYIPIKPELVVFTVSLSAGGSSSASATVQWSCDGTNRTSIYTVSVLENSSGTYEKSFIAMPGAKYKTVSSTGPYTSSASVTINVVSDFKL